MQEAIVEPGSFHLDPLGKDEGALELPRRDAAMEEDPALRIVPLAAADDELIVLLRDLQVVHGEAGHGQRNAQPVLGRLLDIVGRVTVGVLGNPVEHLLEVVEAKEERRTENRWT